MLSPARKLLKSIHPEGIPWPWSAVYGLVSGTRVFQKNYDLLARDIISFCASGSLLDVGTGPGRLLLALARLGPELNLTGLDISSGMTAKARKNAARAGLADRIRIVDGAADRLPFENDSFEAVVSSGAVHHWKAPTAGFNEIYRVLKPGGYALIYDVISDTPPEVKRQAAQSFGRFSMLLLWVHAYEEPFYTREDYANLCRPTLFKTGQTKFVGVLCALVMQKS